MRIGDRCTTCHERVDVDDLTVCDTCGVALHADCAPYEQTFECRECGEELGIGALEF